ncbi:MAG: (Fe-S)-binding protein [Dehalococcoidales bacterium]|nr:(Fe-S)-binding protein [Dehalococcoidales bacterium]
MNWEQYEHDMQRCPRCSYCKYIPWRFIKNFDFMEGCPSAARYHWHAYAAGGKFNLSYSLLKERIEIDDTFLDILYKCLMDGSCDIACKVGNDLEPLQHMQELRIKCVDEGYLLPQHLPLIKNLREEDNMMMKPRSERGNWAADLDVKRVTDETAEVLYFAGCRYSYDKELWPVAQSGVRLLQQASVDVGIMGADESCCGGRAYELGYEGELIKFAEHQVEALKTAGVKVLVTPCSDCYSTFKVLYDKTGKGLGIEVYHITQYIEKLIQEGKLRLKKSLPLKVTYHDPCHLGRLGEPWIHWEGKEYKPPGTLTYLHDPPKKYRRGTNGVYDTPRNIINSIPGVDFVEMYRIREYAWCCGSGGGVIDAFPDFARWTANERLREAHAVGAEAIVSACPWCKRNFLDAARETGDSIEVLDIIELVQQSI